MKNYTCWVTKRTKAYANSMPHALIKFDAEDLDDAHAIASVLSDELSGTDLRLWVDTLGEMSGLGRNALRPLVVRVTGLVYDNWYGTFMVAGRTRTEAMANAFELAAWLQGTDVSIDIRDTLDQPEWNEVLACL